MGNLINGVIQSSVKEVPPSIIVAPLVGYMAAFQLTQHALPEPIHTSLHITVEFGLGSK